MRSASVGSEVRCSEALYVECPLEVASVTRMAGKERMRLVKVIGELLRTEESYLKGLASLEEFLPLLQSCKYIQYVAGGLANHARQYPDRGSGIRVSSSVVCST